MCENSAMNGRTDNTKYSLFWTAVRFLAEPASVGLFRLRLQSTNDTLLARQFFERASTCAAIFVQHGEPCRSPTLIAFGFGHRVPSLAVSPDDSLTWLLQTPLPYTANSIL
jgi:hypothetical protein